MKKNKLGFLILHYYAYEETVKCVEYIKKNIDHDNYSIVIVDNNSLNDSYSKLKKKYMNDNIISLIHNNENLGFARGNNVGFRYLKNKMHCDFIVMLNNDVLLLSKDLFAQIIKEYKKSNFATMCPKIYDINDNIHKFSFNLKSSKQVMRDIIKLKILILFCRLRLLKVLMKFIKSDPTLSNLDNYEVRHEDVMLHGCCIIFSPVYINKFDGLDNRTFLYREEELLYLRVKNNNMLSVYNPNIFVKHEEDVSTNLSMPNFYKRKLNTYKNQLISSKILFNELKKYENEGKL